MAHLQDRRKQGRGWVARYVAPDGRERAKSFAKKSDAERWVTTQEAGKLRGEWVDPTLGKITFGEWAERWWKTQTNLRPSSRARDESYFRNHTQPRFGATQLNQITQEDVVAWIAELTAKGLAAGTVRLVYATLSKPLDAAVDARRITATPCRRIPLPRIEHEEMRFLTPEQVEDLAAATAAPYRTLVLTAAYLGPRWGELAGLRVDRLDLLHRKVHVLDQLAEVRGRLELGAPLKTPAARRTVTIPRFLVPMLEGQIATAASRRSGLVFPTPDGSPMRRTNFRRRAWRDATRSAGVEGLRFHDLRHTAVAFAIARGAHALAIKERMGHSSVQTTLDKYGHLLPRLDEAIADGLDELYASASSSQSHPMTSLARDLGAEGRALRPELGELRL